MVERQRKKKNRVRGQRSHGKGNTKNRRGAGCRGGRGNAGSKKHKRFNHMHRFGTKIKLKTKQLRRQRPELHVINLDDLNERLRKLEKQNKLEKDGAFILVDGEKMNLDKLLSRGTPAFKVKIRNIGLSKKAIEKVEAAQGVVEMEAEPEAEAEVEAEAVKAEVEEAPAEAPAPAAEKVEAKAEEKTE